MQDVFIADKTGTARVTLWEENVGKVEEGRRYTRKNFVVRVYQDLTMGEDAEVIAIEDIGTVALLPEEDSEHDSAECNCHWRSPFRLALFMTKAHSILTMVKGGFGLKLESNLFAQR